MSTNDVASAPATADNFDGIVRRPWKWICAGVFHSLRQMLNFGRAIARGSSAAAHHRAAKTAADTVTKHSVAGPTRVAAADYSEHNIRANCLCPVLSQRGHERSRVQESNPAFAEIQ